jgi:hypothetical protein
LMIKRKEYGMKRALLTLLMMCFLITASATAASYERLEGVIISDTLVHNVIKIQAEEEVFITVYGNEEKLTITVKPPNTFDSVDVFVAVNYLCYFDSSVSYFSSGDYYIVSLHQTLHYTNKKSTYRALSRFT